MFDALDAVMLARLQFAFTVSFHIVFPAFSIGLASYLAVLEGIWLIRRDEAYLKLFDYWKTVFAVVFGMGVVSGLVMSYEFGTNWAVFSDKAGPVIGPLLGYEVLTAFFLEAGFLGVMLFGLKRVGPGLHFVSTLMVAAGTLISATWILAVMSWMQTPAGYATNEVGQFVPTNWLAIIFSPSFPYRLVHMVLAAYLTTAFVVGGVGALHLLRDATDRTARIMFSMAMWMAVVVAPLQLVAGDLHGLNTFQYQPAKVAALEGHYETQQGAPLYLIGWPDDAAEETRFAIGIPKLGSLILAHDANATIRGLKEWAPEDRPPATLIFWSFRIMVGLGLLMIAVGLWSLVQRIRGRLFDDRLLMRIAVWMWPSGFLAVLAGWITTEVGRQPWTVYGLLRTSESASPVVAGAVATSLTAFVIVYFIVFGAGVFYLFRLVRRPPSAEPLSDHAPVRVARPAPGEGSAS